MTFDTFIMKEGSKWSIGRQCLSLLLGLGQRVRSSLLIILGDMLGATVWSGPFEVVRRDIHWVT